MEEETIYESNSIVDVLEEHLEQVRGESEPRDYFYASEATNRCKQFLWYCLTGAERTDLAADDKLTFSQGNEIHRLLMRTMLESREIQVVTAEADTGSDLIHGRVDCIFSFRGRDDLNVMDIKSSSNQAWKWTPQEKHKTQVQIYMYFFDISNGWLLYLNKNDQRLAEYYVERDDGKVEKILDRLREVKEMVEEGEEPDEPNRDKWRYNLCRYCKFREICDYAKVTKDEKGNDKDA